MLHCLNATAVGHIQIDLTMRLVQLMSLSGQGTSHGLASPPPAPAPPPLSFLSHITFCGQAQGI